LVANLTWAATDSEDVKAYCLQKDTRTGSRKASVRVATSTPALPASGHPKSVLISPVIRNEVNYGY